MDQVDNSANSDSSDSKSESQDPQDMRRALVTSFTDFEKGFRRDYPLFWWMSLIAPVVVTIAILLGMGLLLPDGWKLGGKLVSHALATFFVFGRFIILTGTDEAANITMKPTQLFWLVTYMDFMVALFVTFHMGLLFRIPGVGPKIAMLVWDGKFVMDSQPWIRKIAYWGLVTFVIFPTSTTGSIGGSIFGRLLGLTRLATVSGVLIGSLLGNGIMWQFAEFINTYVKDSVWIKVVGIGLILIAAFFFERRYRAAKQRYLDSQGIDEDAAIDEA